MALRGPGPVHAKAADIWILVTYDVIRHVLCRTSWNYMLTYDIVCYRTYDVVSPIYRH